MHSGLWTGGLGVQVAVVARPGETRPGLQRGGRKGQPRAPGEGTGTRDAVRGGLRESRLEDERGCEIREYEKIRESYVRSSAPGCWPRAPKTLGIS